jgi:hypothetical protein
MFFFQSSKLLCTTFNKLLLMPQQFTWTRRICTATWQRGLNRNTSYYINITYFPLTESISVTNYINVQMEHTHSIRLLSRNIMYLRTVFRAHFNSFHVTNQNCRLETAIACALNISTVCYNVSVKLMTPQVIWSAIPLTHRDYFINIIKRLVLIMEFQHVVFEIGIEFYYII